MNAVLNLVMTAGQKRHEGMYAARVRIFDVEIPCVVTGQLKDFVLVEGGKSVANMIETISFRKVELDAAQESAGTDYTPAKGVFIALKPASAENFIQLKLDAGGLDASGFNWRFMALDIDAGV